MSPQFRKVALIAASLGLLLSLFLALRPEDEKTATTSTPTATTATTTAPATTAEPPEAPPTTIRIVVERGRPIGGIRRATVDRDARIVLTVTADVTDHVHLHGYDLMADVAPGSPARLAFAADVPGRFEVELEDLGVQLAELTVEP